MPGEAPPAAPDRRRAGRLRWELVVLSAALLVLGGTSGFLVLARGERTAHLGRWRAQLQAMADDRRSAVDRWLVEGLGDASIITSYPTAVELASRPAGDPASRASADQARAHLTAVLQSQAAGGGYLTAMVLAANGRVIASGGTSVQLDDSCMELVRNTLTERRPLADLHRHPDGELVVQLTAPVLAGRDATPVGAILLTADPEAWLFPFLRHQPALSDTAETVLWRRDGSSAVLLSPTRHLAAAPLGLRRPLDLFGFAARSALEGRELFVEAVDYRGVPVLAVTRRLEAAPWGLVTKVDREEALRGYRTWRAGALALLGAFVLALAAVAYAGWERRRLQDLAEVEESERKYRLLAENVSDLVWVLDLDSGRFLYVSPSVERLSGFSVEETLAQGLEAILTPESAEHLRQVVLARLERFRAGTVESFVDHVEQRCKDGSTVWVEATSRAVVDDETGRVRVYGCSRDITDRKRVEQEREVTVRLLRVLNSCDDLHDLIRGATRLLQEWLGCDAVGIRLQKGDDFPYFETRGFPPDFVAAESSLCLRNAAGEPVKDDHGNPVLECMCGNVLCGRFDPTLPYFTARGSFWTNSTTELLASTTEADRRARTRNRCNGEGYESVALVALRVGDVRYGLLQVNDRRQGQLPPDRIALLERLADNLAVAIAHRQGQQDLSESEQRYRFLFTNMLEGYALCLMVYEQGEPQDFVYLDVNDAFARLTGLHDVVGKPVSEVIPGIRASNPELFEVFGRVAQSGAPEHLEAFVEPLGFWFSISVYSPEREHFVAVFNDVTERKQAEAAVLQLNTELEQRVQERTAELEHATALLEASNHELEAFSYSVSHDLRAPLRAIDGFSRMLAERCGGTLDAEAQRLIGVVQDSARQMGQLVDDLLSFSRLGRVEMHASRVDMEELARSTFQELAAQHDHPAALLLSDLPEAVGDPAMLRQVWVNLLSNALKFTSPRGGEGRVDVRALRLDGEVVYQVSDNGVGFDMRHADRLFVVFQRLHRESEFPGTGVGLALVQRIVNRHGGRVWAAAAPGEGAAFSFTLGGRDGRGETG